MTKKAPEKKKPVVKAKLCSKKSIVQQMVAPNLFLISTDLKPDEPEFMPVYHEPNRADVRIFVPNLNHQNVQAYRLNHRTTMTVDFGVSMKLPAGHQVRGEVKKEWATRGLLISSVYLENDRLKMVIVNIGTETPLVINHKDVVAQIWIEPVYLFDWR